jgi:four helix bundle protein
VQEERKKLSDRLLIFGASVIKLTRSLRRGPVDNHLARQLLGSATSTGANYEEACSGESREDFIHKLQISLKELNETLYSLKLIDKSQINSTPELGIMLSYNLQ